MGPLELRVYPGENCKGSVYLDDGHTFAYQHGEYLRQEFTCQAEPHAVSVQIGAQQGGYTPWWKTIEVVIYGWSSARADTKLTGTSTPLLTTYDEAAHALHLMLPAAAGKTELRVASEATR
jgi:alpha-glucosidase